MDSVTVESFGWLLTALIIAFGLFLLLRQVILWYFRLNQIADNLAYIADHYRRIDHAANSQREQEALQRIAALGGANGSRSPVNQP